MIPTVIIAIIIAQSYNQKRIRVNRMVSFSPGTTNCIKVQITHKEHDLGAWGDLLNSPRSQRVQYMKYFSHARDELS